MKKNNLGRIVWIVGIYAVLVSILYLVVLYKVKWESKDLNTYLYFYNCSNNLCTTDTKVDDYFSRILCKDDICPYISETIGNTLILNWSDSALLFDYKTGEIIDDDFSRYKYIGNDLFIVTNSENKQGIIDNKGNITVKVVYDNIADYDVSGYYSYEENGLYGIKNDNSFISIEPKFKNIVLINDKMFGAMVDDKYSIYSYNAEIIDSNSYNYMYSCNNIILVAMDDYIDVLNSNLKSTLIMKVNTYSKYNTEKEQETLNIYNDDEYIYFTVYTDDNKSINYKYSIKNNKFV